MISKEFDVDAESYDVALELAEKRYKAGMYSVRDGNLVCAQICCAEPGDCTEWNEIR